MAIPGSRVATIAGGVFCVWVVTAAILFNIIPGPYKKTDYLVVGAVATFVSMGILFAVLLQTTSKPGEPIFGSAPEQQQAPDAQPPETQEPGETPTAD
jgi:hypothetical protein